MRICTHPFSSRARVAQARTQPHTSRGDTMAAQSDRRFAPAARSARVGGQLIRLSAAARHRPGVGEEGARWPAAGSWVWVVRCAGAGAAEGVVRLVNPY